jgi:uncharacterized protein with PIN domain
MKTFKKFLEAEQQVCRYCGEPIIQVGTNIWRHSSSVRKQMGINDARHWTCKKPPKPVPNN